MLSLHPTTRRHLYPYIANKGGRIKFASSVSFYPYEAFLTMNATQECPYRGVHKLFVILGNSLTFTMNLSLE
jgi:hypothetical protein